MATGIASTQTSNLGIRCCRDPIRVSACTPSSSPAPSMVTKCWSFKVGRRQIATRQLARQTGTERCRCLRVHASDDNGTGDNADEKPFGYTRKDVILLGGGIIGFGYALYYGLQAAGVDALVAGNFVQLFVFLGIGVGYISTYLLRVANKEMTYVKQLEDYEEAVMKKRLDEMPETERERLLQEIEQEKEQRAK